MARQNFFFWPAPKNVCPSLVYTISLADSPVQLRALRCSLPRESCLNSRSVMGSHLHIILQCLGFRWQV